LPGRAFALGVRKVYHAIEKRVCQLTDLFPRVKSVRVETMTAESTNYSLPAREGRVFPSGPVAVPLSFPRV